MTATMMALLYVLSGKRYDVYLSHPMTTGACTLEDNIASMHYIATALRAEGYSVFNPADIHEQQWTQAEYMAFYLDHIMSACDMVVFCKGYYQSTGCMREYAYAMEHGMKVLCKY